MCTMRLQTIEAVQPDIVLMELCDSRLNLLSIDEETLMREAKDLNMDKIRTAIKQVSFAQKKMCAACVFVSSVVLPLFDTIVSNDLFVRK